MNTNASAEHASATPTLNSFYAGIYWWMFVAMLTSGFIGYVTLNTQVGREALQTLAGLGAGVVSILYLVVMVGVQMLAARVPAEMAKSVLILFASLNGFLLSTVAFAYSPQNLSIAFLTTAGLFGGLALYGKTTDKDLSGWGPAIFVGMIGAIIVSLLNVFLFQSSTFGVIISAAVVLIFSASIAYDTQRYKVLFAQSAHDPEALEKYTAVGALQMYISFVALFMNILNLLGIFNDD